MKTKTPNPVDIHVGRKVREARLLNGLTQTALAEKLGITFQQLQKYESAQNRVSCSRLYDISRVLGHPVQAFFAGADNGEKAIESRTEAKAISAATLHLVTAYSRLSPKLRASLSKTAKSLAHTTPKTALLD
jgi:transcriptional regulator with XRE-family HTH domain